MSVPPRLAVKLNEVLGADPAEDLVNWMDEMRADHAELRHEVHGVRADLAALSVKVDSLSANVDSLSEKFDALIVRFDKQLELTHALGQRVEYLRGHFIAWNAAFWLTAVTAIVGLLQFLLRR